MNERIRNNCYFHSTTEFKGAVIDFFETTWDKIATSMVDKINDNFQILNRHLQVEGVYIL